MADLSKHSDNAQPVTTKSVGWKFRLGGNRFGLCAVAFDNFWFRVFGKGLSIEPLDDEFHMHLFSTRNAKIQPLHIANHCIKVLR